MNRFVCVACLAVSTAACLLSAGCASTRPAPGEFAVVGGKKIEPPDIRMGDRATVRRVLSLARNDSRVMGHLTELCETFGTRLTGSAACENANRWARDRFEAWGLNDPRLVAWGELDARFDRLESSGDIVKERRRGDDGDPEWEPDRPLEFTTLSWTRGTDGPVVGPVVRMPDSPAAIDEASFEGAWVLLPAHYSGRRGVRSIGYAMRERLDLRHSIRTGAYDPSEAPDNETWSGLVTYDGDELELRFFPERDGEGSIVGGRVEIPEMHGGPITDTLHEKDTLRFVWPNPHAESSIELSIEGESMTGRVDGAHPIELARTTGPDDHALTREADRTLARVLDANPAGFISASLDERVWTTRPNNWRDLDLDNLPTDIEVSVRRSDYDTINSRLADGQDVYARFDLPHTIEPGPAPAYNTIAEIPGTVWPDEVVIVSAHIDSWDGPQSLGTTDNGTGSAVVLEAARLLAQAGARPKRTIRFILWTGEEQGLLGSSAYVGTLSEEERSKISAVFVDDGGTNYEGGIPAADHMVNYLAAATAPLNGVFYSETDGQHLNVNIRPTGEKIKTHGGSDHAPFNKVGVPGFFWDEIGRANYGVGWHTQNDRLDLAIEEYLVQSSACMAITAYNLACAPALLPREPSEKPGPVLARLGSVSEQPTNGR